ncbi:hypothetical protein SAMN04488003_104109 [Loktanella fryxellensis]|uniref:Argininosuccinate lyase n=1 Tax=Loktanella fryxellensis TaxID=245187 RepID=A0A1H8B0B8_9RHOB|nr:hypothetical protein [Loktanella fryxellensis]SEM76213.1 hypothetical protein SAMN04488003_104109 [Loktanella fryxellensis]
MTRIGLVALVALAGVTLAGCGVQGDPVPPGGVREAGGTTASVGVGVGPNGVTPGVTLADGIGRVSLGPGGVRLGAAGIPLALGL